MAELVAGVALVTGASRGIGQSIAQELARNGATVVGTATTETGAKRIQNDFAQAGLQGTGMVLDITDVAGIQNVVSRTEETFGSIGILVNNAGITRDGLLLRMNDASWDDVIATNLSAVYRMCKVCLRAMSKARKGRIINIASVVGSTGNAGQCNYAAAKAGVIGFTKSLAREVASRGITVNAVAPGFIDTDMTRSLDDSQRESLLGQIPLGRLGDVVDVAKSVVFLASTDAGYITGETLHVNGGMYMA